MEYQIKKKRVAWNKGLKGVYVTSDETRAKLKGRIPWNKGLKGVQIVSDETRAKLSIARMGNTYAKGTKHTAEYKAEKSRMFKALHADGVYTYHRGKDAHNWRGGTTSLSKCERTSNRYKAWRTAVFERDNYTCQGCDERGGYLEAHHILSWAKFPKARFEVSNGMALCLPCHEKTDSYKGKNNKRAI